MSRAWEASYSCGCGKDQGAGKTRPGVYDRDLYRYGDNLLYDRIDDHGHRFLRYSYGKRS